MKNETNISPIENDGYDDGNIPDIDLPDNNSADMEDDRPRRDGPGGE